MQHGLTSAAERRLNDFLEQIGSTLGNRRRRASFAAYALGLLGDGERKSVEPIAARTCPDPDAVDAVHQQLLHFVSNSDWSDRRVRLQASRYALSAMMAKEPVDTWILDDTGFLKQGKHSVGVQRQYTGSAGKVTNCQIGVSLTLATRNVYMPVDFDLYLPRSWLDDPDRRHEARIPDDLEFRTKVDLAMDMIRRAVDSDLPRGVVLADSFYGDSTEFRALLRRSGLHYAVGVSYNLKVWPVLASGRRSKRTQWLGEIAEGLPATAYRKVTWRNGTKQRLASHFAFKRVVPCHSDGVRPSDREHVWLVIEWEAGEESPNKFFFVSLPETTSMREIVRVIKQRWLTERMYEDLKGELGLDHFEGRRYRGWHHHISVVLCCAAFVVAEQCRSFSPSAPGGAEGGPEPVAA